MSHQKTASTIYFKAAAIATQSNRCKINRTLKMARVVSEREAVKIGLETIHFYLQREGDGMELGAASSGNIFQTRLLGGVGSSNPFPNDALQLGISGTTRVCNGSSIY